MESTLLVGDHLLMSRIGYDAGVPFTRYHVRLWREPHRGQVVIFHAPPATGFDEDFIKRLIGIPGDTVEIHRGIVIVNGTALTEPYRKDPPDPFEEFGPVNIPAKSYFVLGDNRDDSYDSRRWGFVPESAIIGTPVFIYMSVQASDDAWQPGQVRERPWGRSPGGMASRRGLFLSRSEMTGSATPHSAPMAGSSHATPSSSLGL